jgi:hypothetical protein
LFYLDRFAEAKTAFQRCTELGKDASSWLRKCDAELKLAAEATSAAVPAPSSAATPAAASSAAAPLTLVQKMKDPSTVQTPTHMTLTIYAKDTPKENFKINLQDNHVSVHITFTDGSVFAKEYELAFPIVVAESAFTITAFKVEIKMKKQQEKQEWPGLEKSAVAGPVRSMAAAAGMGLTVEFHVGLSCVYRPQKFWNGCICQ